MIAIVPARMQSKQSVNKNFAPFVAGRCLVDWACFQGIAAVLETYYSVDDEKWESKCVEARKIFRPPFLAQPATPTWAVIEHALYSIGKFSTVIILQPTSPLRTVDDIFACVELSNKENQNVTSTNIWGNPNGAVYVRRWKKWEDEGVHYVMPWCRSCDIDLETDFEAARILMQEAYAKEVEAKCE